MLNEVCSDVREEPPLQEITGENFKLRSANVEKYARLDVSARGFWIRGQKAFCDIRVFNPLAKCYRKKTLEAIHQNNEKEKKRVYGQRILEVEHGTFTPLVFSCFGGMSHECFKFYQRLAELIAEKRKINISETSNYIRTKINFSLIRSMLLCIRGSRSINNNMITPVLETDIELANVISAINE